MSWADKQEKIGRRRGADTDSPKKGKRDEPEARLQRAVYSTLQMWADQYNDDRLRWVFHVPNGGRRAGVGRFLMSAEGVLPGVPDLVYPFPNADGSYGGAYQELKSTTGTLRPSQKDFLSFAFRNGAACSVANTLLGAVSFWRWYFGVPVSDIVMANQANTLSAGVAIGGITDDFLWRPRS